MERFGIIYKATNKINGKVYIGQTIKSLRQRKSRHKWESKRSYFHNALNKYGFENFKWEILEYCNSKRELDEMEFHYIKQYNSLSNGYNLTLGGEGVVGNKVSKESRRKMSLSHKGIKMPPFTESHKRKISESRIGNKNPNFGKPMPKHVKDMLIGINTGKIISEETRKKMSNAAKNRAPMSVNTRLKISKAKKNMVGSKNPISKKYVIETPDNDVFVVNGLRYFCKKYSKEKLNQSNLSACALGNRLQHKGYKCRYFNPDTDKHLTAWEAN